MQLSAIILRTFLLAALQFVPAIVSVHAQYQGGVWRPANGPYGGKITALITAADGSMIAGTAGGIYRSTDNGESWTIQAGPFTAQPVNGLARDSSGFLYAATTLHVVGSYDNGLSWRLLQSDAQPSLNAHSIVILDSTEVIVGGIASLYQLARGPIGDIYWREYPYDNISQNTAFTALAVQKGVIYAGTSNAGMFSSNDGGKTIVPIEGLPCDTVMSIESMSAGPDDAILMVGTACGLFNWYSGRPSDWAAYTGPLEGRPVAAVKLIDNIVYAGTRGHGIFRMVNGGGDWDEVYHGMESNTINAIEGFPKGRVFCGTLHGVQRTDDYGTRWVTASNGIRATTIHSLVINQKGNLFAATETGVYRSTDRGESWQEKNYLLTDRDVWRLAHDQDSNIYAGTRGGKLFRSRDDGDSWDAIESPQGAPINAIAFDAEGNMLVGMAGTEGRLYTNRNVAPGWNMILKEDIRGLTRYGSIIYALAGGKGLLGSADFGETWPGIYTMHAGANCVAVDATPEGKIVVGGQQYVNVNINNGIGWYSYRQTPCESINVAMWTAKGNLIIGGSCGVFSSHNNGLAWSYDMNGLNVRTITAFAGYSDETLVAGTNGAGIYLRENTIPTNSVDISINVASSLAIDAGAAMQTGMIALTVDRPGNYAVTLYDPLGRQVEIIADRQFDIGSHRIEHSFDGLASGVYLLQARGSGSVSTTKVVVDR